MFKTFLRYATFLIVLSLLLLLFLFVFVVLGIGSRAFTLSYTPALFNLFISRQSLAVLLRLGLTL